MILVNYVCQQRSSIVDHPPTSPNYDLYGAFFHQALRENDFSLGPLVFNKLTAFKDGEGKPFLNNFLV